MREGALQGGLIIVSLNRNPSLLLLSLVQGIAGIPMGIRTPKQNLRLGVPVQTALHFKSADHLPAHEVVMHAFLNSMCSLGCVGKGQINNNNGFARAT
jgi:hypothetical protein